MSLLKFILIIIVLGINPWYSAAQPVLGASAGIGIGRLYNALPPADGGFDYGLSMTTGIHAGLNLVDQLDAMIECSYLQIRSTRPVPMAGVQEPATKELLRLDYLEWSLLIRRYVGNPRQALRPYICFGPFFSRLLLDDQSHVDSSIILRFLDFGTSREQACNYH